MKNPMKMMSLTTTSARKLCHNDQCMEVGGVATLLGTNLKWLKWLKKLGAAHLNFEYGHDVMAPIPYYQYQFV